MLGIASEKCRIRDTARVLHVSPTTVINELKNRFVGWARHLWWKQLQWVRYHRLLGRSDRPFTGASDPV